MAVAVSQNLDFNVPGPEDQLFQIHLPVAETGNGLGLGAFEGLL